MLGRAGHRLCGAWCSGSAAVSLSLTPCIVTSPPGRCDGLCNSANERLEGTNFTPSECVRRLPGEGIVYPPQTVDGLVSELGGPELAASCRQLPMNESGYRCAVGSAVITRATGELTSSGFEHVVHAVAPAVGDGGGECARHRRALVATFSAAFACADAMHVRVLAVPLLGAGARGTPVTVAADAAAEALVSWQSRGELRALRFACADEATAAAIGEAFDSRLGKRCTTCERSLVEADHECDAISQRLQHSR